MVGTIGADRSGVIQFADIEIESFRIASELYKPDGNGLTYTGSNGTIVTRNTGHADGLNYVNLQMINKI